MLSMNMPLSEILNVSPTAIQSSHFNDQENPTIICFPLIQVSASHSIAAAQLA